MSTGWKVLFIGFFVVQIGVDLAHSLTLFPFIHYGMYSESFSRQDTQAVFAVTVNGNRLRPADFRINRWDMIQSPLLAAEQQAKTRDFVFDREKLQQGMQKIRAGWLYRLAAPNLSNAAGTSDRFPAWYQQYLERLLGYPVRSLQVDKEWYEYRNRQFYNIRNENWFVL